MDFTQLFSPFFLFFLLKSTIFPSSLPHSSTFPNNFALHDDARFTKEGAISLTRDLHGSIGRAFHAPPIHFLDPSTNSTPSFSCTFSFTISTAPSSAPGEGLAFLIASANSSSSGHLGLPMGGVPESFLAVVFDTSFDLIGLDVDGVVISVAGEAADIDLKSGKKITSWVEYQDEKGTIRIWVSHSSIKPSAPIISTHVDLSEKVLKDFMQVGFSASNGPMGSALHFVDNWEFSNFGFLSTVAAKEEEGLSWKDIGRIISRLVVLLGLALWIVVIVFYSRRYLSRRLKGKVPRRRLLRLTNGFDAIECVGQETAAVSVYRGRPFLAKAVTIKRFEKLQRGPNFEQSSLGRAANVVTLKHQNLLQLQGWCFEESEVILVYEYVDGQTLRQILDSFDDTSRGELDWERSVRILREVASALAYLHGKEIVHNDVETCSIMLDGNMKAKLGGFGFQQKSQDDRIRRAYFAPEYVNARGGTMKTDVYSFGVVVLEVVTGFPPVDGQEVMLVDKVLREEDLERELDVAHARAGNTCDKQVMRQVLELGHHCVSSTSTERLKMSAVESVLRGEFSLHDAVEAGLT